MRRLLSTPRALSVALAVCLFALIVGAKWATFDRYGSPIPDWDQWDAEGGNLLIPWHEGSGFLEKLFAPHNEHRVVLTKLQNLALTLAAGQWDSRLEAAVNALLHAALAVALWLGARRWVAGRWHAALFVLAFALFGLPVAWQNILGGFHSQQYWLLGLSTVAIAVLPFARPWSARWWIGAIAALLALGSMGSGLLAAFVVIVVCVWRAAWRETTWRELRPTLAWCAVLLAIGLLTRVEVPWHAEMKAKTASDFFLSILRSMAWPLRDRDWSGLLLWLPWGLAAWRLVRDPASRPGQIIVALGGWVLVQLAATAYARGAGADYPASRYMDTLSFGAMINATALAWLLSAAGAPRAQRWLGGLTAAAWIVLLTLGLRGLLRDNFGHDLPDARKYYDEAEANLRHFLATGDRGHFTGKGVPYPNVDSLVDYLSNPALRPLFPVPIRPPLALAAAEGPVIFVENDARAAAPENPPKLGLPPSLSPLAAARTWGSFAATPTTGTWRSAPLDPPKAGWLKFETAGDLGREGAAVSLSLRDARTGALLAEVRPGKIPGESWRAAYVRAPDRPFVVEAHDDSAGHWLAFSGPVEMGAPAYWARQANKHGLVIAQIAAGGAAVLFGAMFLASRRQRARAAAAEPAPAMAGDFIPLRRPVALALAAGLFLAVWGVKLATVDRYGSDLPYWDPWGKEGDHLLMPWFDRGEFWDNLFRPHNEHRMFPTLALNFGLAVGSGQWDARVQCVFNSAVHALLAAGLFLWSLRRLPRPWALATGAVLLLTTAAPIAIENVLSGFQSVFYFLTGFSVLAIAGLLGAPALSRWWWIGFGAGLLALVSLGSGLLVAAPIGAVALLRCVHPAQRREALMTLAAAAALGLAGVLLRTPAPWHADWLAKNPAQFLAYAARCLAWPVPHWPWLAPLLWLPWIALLATRLRAWREAGHGPRLATDVVLAAGLWVLLQVAAVSFARGGAGGLPANRYGDVTALGFFIAIAALSLLAARFRFVRWFGAAWCALAATCLALATRDALREGLPDTKAKLFACEKSVQAFVLTDDFTTFAKQTIPYPSIYADWLARILRHPGMREVLPASVRTPLRIEGFSATPPPEPAAELQHRRVVSVPPGTEWRSAVLPAARFGWWKIETSGSAFDPALPPPLRLESPDGTAIVAPSRPPGVGEWRAAYVPAPRAPAVLVARAPADQTLAFSEPVELAALSYRAWRLTQHGWWVVALGAVLLGLSARIACQRVPRSPAP
ncbi:MAG: hypothetical protein JNK23_17410 [Opitutaceae bacterium]|nr:hypothetical protein [Opitutaceae bacterium]